MSNLGDSLYGLLQRVLPQHALSRVIHRTTRIRWRWFKNLAIRVFARLFQVDCSDAQRPVPDGYASFNDFFTRELNEGARPLGPADQLLSPVDGKVSQAGELRQGRVLQAKGRDYAVADLLGSEDAAAPFAGGQFATIYLAPDNYHRIHMPVQGRLTAMRLVPGRLFSVDARTTRAIPRLFARNERVIAHFDTDNGPVAVVMVGALFVGSIETVWHGEVTPGGGRAMREWRYGSDAPVLMRGEELARFNMGSTVILVTARDQISWQPQIIAGQPLRMGQPIATLLSANQPPDDPAAR